MKQRQALDRNRKILVVGDVMLDQYFEGSSNRVSPEAPVPVLKVSREFSRPGGAANVALNIAALGLGVTVLAYVGQDRYAGTLQDALTCGNVNCAFLIARNARTIVKTRALCMRQQMLRMDFEDSFEDEDHVEMIGQFRELVASHDLVVFSDYAKGTLAKVAKMIEIARLSNKLCLVDPKGSSFEKYRNADVLTPNLGEFAAIVGEPADEAALAEKAHTLMSDYSIGSLIVTRGEKGMTLVRPGHGTYSIPAEAQEVFDVTGAGDTVIATLSAALASGMDMQGAMRLANAAAAIVVSRKGTSAVSSSDLEMRAARYADRVISEGDVLAEIAEARIRGEIVVMTNGCFDILHAGHVAYLQAAKDLGDRLVVAVNSDASVTRLKGRARPINALESRLEMLLALKCVDWVVSFDGSATDSGGIVDTPLDIIKQVRPDVLVKGGDYTKANIVGAAEVEQYGGRVEILPFVDGLSTSMIASRLKLAS